MSCGAQAWFRAPCPAVQALGKNTSVTSLRMSECRLSALGAASAAGLIRVSPVLQRLDLSHNMFGPEVRVRMFSCCAVYMRVVALFY